MILDPVLSVSAPYRKADIRGAGEENGNRDGKGDDKGDAAPYNENRGENELKIITINVAKGDSTLVISPAGKSMLIDTGQTGNEVLPVLRREGISEIDYLVSTHYDSDHIGGTDRVIAGEDWEYGTADDVEVVEALDRGDENMKSNSFIDDYFEALSETGCGRRSPAVGEVIDLGGATALCVCLNGDVLGEGCAKWELSENALSMGFLITMGGFDFLVCGDLTWDVEDLLADGITEYDVDVLHLNHHGSASSTSWDFTEAAWPENAVVSVGSSNSYGHPHEEVLENLNCVEGPCGDRWLQNIYMTESGSGDNTADNLIDVEDDIVIVTDGRNYSINGDEYHTDDLDTDGDGMPDIWEEHVALDRLLEDDAGEDRDRDGLSELGEWEWWTCPRDDDTDDDGMPDGWEVDNGLDPWKKDGYRDEDRDDLDNIDEYEEGTDPNEADSDGDGMPDGWEVQYGLDPRDPDDGGLDPDGDNLTNADEYRGDTDPNKADNPGNGGENGTGDNDNPDNGNGTGNGTGSDDNGTQNGTGKNGNSTDGDGNDPGNDNGEEHDDGRSWRDTNAGKWGEFAPLIILGITVLLALLVILYYINSGKKE